MGEKTAKLVLTYNGQGLTIHGEGVPAALAVWMLETAKVSLITKAGKQVPTIEGLDLSPLNPRKLR